MHAARSFPIAPSPDTLPWWLADAPTATGPVAARGSATGARLEGWIARPGGGWAGPGDDDDDDDDAPGGRDDGNIDPDDDEGYDDEDDDDDEETLQCLAPRAAARGGRASESRRFAALDP